MGVCCTSDEKQESNKHFEKMDTDHNNTVSRAELAGPQRHCLAALYITAC